MNHCSPARPLALRLGLAGLASLMLSASACERRERAMPREVPLPVRILADSAASRRLRVEVPDPPQVWLSRVRQAPPPAPPAAPLPQAIDPPLPEAWPDTAIPETEPALVVDPDLEPPILREAAELRIPPGAGGRTVVLDVKVDETGQVTDVRWAGGSRDFPLLAAARDCAESMRFYPARRGGRPVAVWCRQRFDFGG